MKKFFNITINGTSKPYEQGTPYIEIAKEYQKDYEDDIVLVLENMKLKELRSKVNKDCELKFLTTHDDAGASSYRRSATMIMLKAFYDVIGAWHIKKIEVHFSASSGYFCTIDFNAELTESLIQRAEDRMREIVSEGIEFEKEVIKTDMTDEIFSESGMHDKAKLFKYRSASNTNIYKLGSFRDYFYGFMVPNTSYIKYFKLYPYDDGFILQMPSKRNPKVVPELNVAHNVYCALKESEQWASIFNATSVGELNDIIVSGNYQDIILVQEALQEAKIANIVQQIISQKTKRFVMIAGPSSSGKTTFSRRMCVQLMAHGLKPHAISVDNYYVEREHTPLDENGNYDFENITAIDLELFNNDMAKLLNGETVPMPTFNFVTGHREYHGEELRLGDDDILVIEGIHCLNDEMSRLIPANAKFRIYISALMMLNLDEHNRIATTDGRLIRRMVRDARTRGKKAEGTLEMWDSVRKGEERFIFPYQDKADVVFNSSMIYELFVMRQYARPLLLSIQKDAPEYSEANRLLKFFDYIIDIPNDAVPANSILREFIGGGCFRI